MASPSWSSDRKRLPAANSGVRTAIDSELARGIAVDVFPNHSKDVSVVIYWYHGIEGHYLIQARQRPERFRQSLAELTRSVTTEPVTVGAVVQISAAAARELGFGGESSLRPNWLVANDILKRNCHIDATEKPWNCSTDTFKDFLSERLR